MWSIEENKCLCTFEGHKGKIIASDFRSSSDHVLTASTDMTAKLWNAATGECLVTFEGHQDSVVSLSVAAAGKNSQNHVDMQCENVLQLDERICFLDCDILSQQIIQTYHRQHVSV